MVSYEIEPVLLRSSLSPTCFAEQYGMDGYLYGLFIGFYPRVRKKEYPTVEKIPRHETAVFPRINCSFVGRKSLEHPHKPHCSKRENGRMSANCVNKTRPTA